MGGVPSHTSIPTLTPSLNHSARHESLSSAIQRSRSQAHIATKLRDDTCQAEEEDKNQANTWECKYDFRRMRWIWIHHQTKQIRRDPPTNTAEETSASPSNTLSSYYFVDLPSSTYSTAIERELIHLLQVPRVNSGDRWTCQQGHTSTPSTFQRWSESITGSRIRRHYDRMTLMLSRFLAEDAIKSPDELIRYRKTYLTNVSNIQLQQLASDKLSATSSGVGDPRLLPAFITKLSDIMANRKGKQLLQQPAANLLLQLLESIPNSSIGPCSNFYDDLPVLGALWKELEQAARILTLNLDELEFLVKIPLNLCMKTMNVSQVLKTIELWNLVTHTYSSVRMPGLLQGLQRFSLEVLNRIWKKIGLTEPITAGVQEPGTHYFAAAYRNHLLTRVELKLESTPPLPMLGPIPMMGQESGLSYYQKGLTFSQVRSFILAHVGTLAETQIWFKKFNHLRVPYPTPFSTTSSNQSSPPIFEPNARPSGIVLPLTLDLTRKNFEELCEHFHEVMQRRQNERMNYMLNYGVSGSGNGNSSSTINQAILNPKLVQLNQALHTLFSFTSLSSPDHIKATKLLVKLLSNVLSDPGSEKYRRIKSNHPSFIQLIGSRKERLEILKVSGFEIELPKDDSSSTIPAAAAMPTSPNTVFIPITPGPSEIRSPTNTPPFAGLGPPALLPQTSFTSSGSDATTPPSTPDEFMFLPTNRLDLNVIQYLTQQLQRTLQQLQQLQTVNKNSLMDKTTLKVQIGGGNTASSSTSAATSTGNTSNLASPPFPFLPSMVSPTHPQASHYDYLHFLSLLRLFFYAAQTYNVDADAFSSRTTMMKNGQLSLWKTLIDHLLSLLELHHTSSSIDLNSGSLFRGVDSQPHLSNPFVEQKDDEQIRGEHDRIVECLIQAFPFVPANLQITIVQASLKDDVLRSSLLLLIQEQPGVFHLLPLRSKSPYQSVWERLRKADSTLLQAISQEPQLIHLLIAQFHEHGQLNLSDPSSHVYQFWSSSMKKVMDYLRKTQGQSSKQLLLLAHAGPMASAPTNVSHGSSALSSPPLMSDPSSPNFPSLSLSYPSLSRTHTGSDDAATNAKEFRVGAALMSPTTATTSSSSSVIPSPIVSPSPIREQNAGLNYLSPIPSAIASMYPSPSPPLPSPSPIPTSPSSPSPSPPPSGMILDWNVVGGPLKTASGVGGGIGPEIDLQAYTQVLEALLQALHQPATFSPITCLLSSSNPTTVGTLRSQYALMFQTLVENWFSRAVCPVTSFDILFAPVLLKSCLSVLIRHVQAEIQDAKQLISRKSSDSDPMQITPTEATSATWQQTIRDSPLLALVTPMLLTFNAVLNLTSISLDPQLLSQLYNLHTEIGGFEAWNTSEEKELDPFILPAPETKVMDEYQNYFKFTLPSNSVLEFTRAREDGSDSPLVHLLKSRHDSSANVIQAAVKLQQATQTSSVIPMSCLPLPTQIVQIIEEQLFSVKSPPSNVLSVYPSASQVRLHQPSLNACHFCGELQPDADSMLQHAIASNVSTAVSNSSCLCAHESAVWSVRRHALLSLIGSTSRHLASSHTTTDLIHQTHTSLDVRIHPDGSPVKVETSATINNVVANATNQREADAAHGSTNSSAVPKTIAQWMQSDLFKAGLESTFLHPTATNSPVMGPLSTDQVGSIDLSGSSDFTASAKLFPFFHSAANSANASKFNSPDKSNRSLPLQSQISSDDDSFMTDKFSLDSSGQSHEAKTRGSFESPRPASHHEKFHISTGGILQQISGIADKQLDAYDTTMSAKETSSQPGGTPHKEESDAGDKMVDSNVLQLQSPPPIPTQITVQHVQLDPTISPSLQPILMAKDGGKDFRKSLHITTQSLPSGDVQMTDGSFQSFSAQTPVGKATPTMLSGHFTSFPPSPMFETYSHSNFLTHLILGEGESRMLDDTIMALPPMRIYAQQRKMVGEVGARACRAVVACLLKHTGKIELAIQFSKQQLAQSASGSKVPASLIKLWKLSCELLPEFISLHQNGLLNYCAQSGCDQTVVEDPQIHGAYRCGHGHLSQDCISKETVKYEQLAQRVMHSCEFLLKLKPAYTVASNETDGDVLSKQRAARLRKLLRVKPLDIPFSPPGNLTGASSPQPSDNVMPPVNTLKRSNSSTLSLWSPSPRPVTPAATQSPTTPNTTTSSLLPPLHTRSPTTPNASFLSRTSSDTKMMSPSSGKDLQLTPPRAPSPSKSPSPPSARQIAVRESVRKELAQHRWQDLRNELLASRMPSLMHPTRVPLTSLIMAFCRDVTIDTYHRAQQLDAQIRSAVILAEHRIRGLESLAYLIRHAPIEYKAAAIMQWNGCIEAWQVNGHHPNHAVKTATDALAESLHIDSANKLSMILHTPFLVPHRYDFQLHSIGQGLLNQVQDAFYLGMGVNLGLMHHCMLTLGLKESHHTNLDGSASLVLPYSSFQQVERLRRQQSDSTRSSPTFGATLYTSSFSSTFTSLVLQPSQSLAFLLVSLNSWFVSYSSSTADFSFIHTARFLALIEQLIFHFAETILDTNHPLNDGDDDRVRCQSIGRQARRLFRLLVLSVLTQKRTDPGSTDEDVTQQESSNMQDEASIANDQNLTPHTELWLGGKIQQDSFEANILHTMFNRLEELLHHRLRLSQVDSSISHSMHGFIHVQDEKDCFDTLSLLLLSCSAVHIKLALTHHVEEIQIPSPPSPWTMGISYDDAPIPLSSRCFQLLALLLHPSYFPKLSLRCQRRTIGLCHSLLPLVTPKVIELLWNQDIEQVNNEGAQDLQPSSAADPMEISPKAAGLPNSSTNLDSPARDSTHLIPYLLQSIGYYICGKFLESGSHLSLLSHDRCQHLVSELISLVRHLHQSKSWSVAVSSSLAEALAHLKHVRVNLSEPVEVNNFYSAYAAVLVYGGFIEPIRVGAKVNLFRICSRAEKLSQRDSKVDAGSMDRTEIGIVVGFEGHQPIVIKQNDPDQELFVLPLASCEARPRYECTQPLHLYGTQGLQNLTHVVRYLNSAFAPVSPETSFPFSLFPFETPNKQHLQYLHSSLKVHAMRALAHCLSLVLTRPELVAENIRLYTAATDGSPQLNTMEVVIQTISKEAAALSSDSSRPSLPLLSNLLAIGQQVIPISAGVGKLSELNTQLCELHSHIHEQADSPPPMEQIPPNVHADLMARAFKLFPNDMNAAVNWARLKQHLRMESVARRQQVSQQTGGELIKPLLDMGFDEALCKRALLLHNGDATQSMNWLMEHGFHEMDAIRKGQLLDVWGLEGVDFYQEKGHWIPQVSVAVEEEEEAMLGTKVVTNSKSKDEKKESSSSSKSSLPQMGSPRSRSAAASLPHAPPMLDPYRRLTLYTAPEMSEQAMRSEAVYRELTGTGSTADKSNQLTTNGWSLEANEIRPGIGQRLRLSTSWISQQRASLLRSSSSHQSYRWYFLTEDNHWAPLDPKEMTKLDRCYEGGESFCWIGVEEKSPSLIRLDKMCMYNEITGHGRPLRRKAVEQNPLHPKSEKPVKQEEEKTSSASSSSEVSSTAPTASFYLFDNLSPERKALATNLSGMGFPLEWCALALIESSFSPDHAANWLLNDANVVKCEAHDAAIRTKQQAAQALILENKKRQEEQETKLKLAQSSSTATSSTKHEKRETEVGLNDPDASVLKKQKLSHDMDQSNASSFSAELGNEEIDMNLLAEFSGQLGTVLAVSSNFYSNNVDKSEAKVLLEFSHLELSSPCRCWVPFTGLEWDTEQLARVIPDYTKLHEMQFGAATSTTPTSPSASSSNRKITHAMQQHLWQQQEAARSTEMSSSHLNSIFNLATDVTTSIFMVYARKISLLCIYLLSLPQPKNLKAATPPLGFVEMITHLSATSFMKILKLASVDPTVTLEIDSDFSDEQEVTAESVTGASLSLFASGGNQMPSTPGLIPRNDLEMDLATLTSSTNSGSSSTEQQATRSQHLPHHPWSIDVWLVLSTLLHNPSPLFSTPSRDQLFSYLIEDLKKSLISNSYFVRDIDTEHPYQSGITETLQEISIPGSQALLVTFDRRCNLNQSHAMLSFYSDSLGQDELAVFSGSSDEFSHVVLPGSRFYYSFRSGAVRAKPYEFGFRFRVRPIGFELRHEKDVLVNINPALASAINMNAVNSTTTQQQQALVGVMNTTAINSVLPPDKVTSFAYHLGWPLLLLLTDSPALIDIILLHHSSLDLLQTMLRYLTVCRSPNKVLVTRALTMICTRIKTPLAPSLFEILLRVMEQLYESNTASGWGSSPFLMTLIDLIRLRPTSFKLSDADLWNVETMDNRPANWFFLTIVRAESLSKALITSSRLPHTKLIERAFTECSDLEILRWCLKQPELCLKLHKQAKGWNQARREWMVGINNFQTIPQISDVLIQLKDSLLPECFRLPGWLNTAGKEWESQVRASRSVADLSRCYMLLESSLKWGDSFAESDRAFGDTWSSRRQDWLQAMRGLASERVVRVASVQDAFEYKWTRAMDEALIRHWDEYTSKHSRRLMSLTFRDIEPLTLEQVQACTAGSGPNASVTAAALRQVSFEQLRARFAILKMLSTDYMRVLPIIDLGFQNHNTYGSMALQSTSHRWSVSPLIKATTKTLIFHQSKMYFWRSMLGRLYSEERPQFVILNRHQANKARSTVASKLQNSLFYQLYSHVGMLSDPSSLRRRGQAWMVKFVGEGGHDVGGMYNESLVELCNELQSETAIPGGSTEVEGNQPGTSLPTQPLLPLFRLCPNGHSMIGENRSKFLPNPDATRPLHLALFEFLGRLMGVCCLDNNRALSLNLPDMVWKVMVGESLTLQDLKGVDFHTWRMIQMMKSAHTGSTGGDGASSSSGSTELTSETFPYLFPDLTFSVEIEIESSDGRTPPTKQVIDLIPHGRTIPVTFSGSYDYARLLEKFYLKRYSKQLRMMCKGMSSIIPFEFLSIFTSSQLEILITGNPDINIDLLREKTEYRGNISDHDRHILLFWEVLQDFTQDQRKNFLQFTWGRNRLPSNALGFGKDLFKLSDHTQAVTSGAHDQYLPISHTCFFALELPRYSTKAIMSSKLLYAISNCQSIDGDATHEGRANMMMAWEEEEE